MHYSWFLVDGGYRGYGGFNHWKSLMRTAQNEIVSLFGAAYQSEFALAGAILSEKLSQSFPNGVQKLFFFDRSLAFYLNS